jgi:RNase P/RNase MRP subunit p29
MFPLPPHNVSPSFAIGEPVRVIEPSGEVAPGAQGRVVGYYRNDPPRTLVAFDGLSCAVPDSRLERAY